jgi:hypothetical protein
MNLILTVITVAASSFSKPIKNASPGIPFVKFGDEVFDLNQENTNLTDAIRSDDV